MGLLASTNPILPPNNPPVWESPDPNPTWVDGVGGTYDLNSNTSDAEGDTLIFVKTAGSFPTGVTLNSNGILTATSSVVEGTTAGFTITADDGTAAPVASPTFSIVITASGQSFPLLGISAIGGWGQNGLDNKPGGMPGRMERIAAHDISIIGAWRTWTFGGSTGPAKNTSTICTYIKTFNASLLIYNYTNVTEASDSRQANIEPFIEFADTKAPAERWWLYDGSGFVYPDDVKFGGGNFPDAMINHSNSAPIDSAGLYAGEWFARALHANSGDAGDWATSGFGFRAEYGFDGEYKDIDRYEPRTAGDWNTDGSEDAKDSAVALAQKFDGDQRYHAEWASLEPTDFYHAGNYTQNAGVPGPELVDYNLAIASGYQNLVNGVFLEALMGRSSSIESFSSWNAMMRYYKRGMTLNAGMDPQHTFFDNWETDGFSESDPNIWDGTHSLFDWGRYGLCSCLLDNGYYGFPTSGGFVDANILDEYSFDLGTAVDPPNYDGNDPTTSTSGSGYNDYELGVYGRRFANGHIWVNPKGNGEQTITLPVIAGFHHNHLDAANYANQDPGVNDGATNVTTLTLPERHAQITALVAD